MILATVSETWIWPPPEVEKARLGTWARLTTMVPESLTLTLVTLWLISAARVVVVIWAAVSDTWK